MNTTSGTVQAVTKTGTGIKVNEQWYSHFANTVPCKKGDQVEIDFTRTEKGGRVYQNWSAIRITTPAPALQTFQKEAREDKAQTMREAYCKDLIIAMIEKAIADKNPKFDIMEATKLAIDISKQIKEGIEAYSKEKPKEEDKQENPDY